MNDHRLFFETVTELIRTELRRRSQESHQLLVT